MARGNAIVGTGVVDLLKFQPSICAPGFRKSGLQKSAATAAAEIIGPVRRHVDKIVFPDAGFDHKPQIFGDRVPQGLAYQLAGILDSEGDPQLFVPVRVEFELSLPDPFGIILDDTFDLEIVWYLEFIQPDPD